MGKFMFNLYLSMKCNVYLQVPIPLNGQGPFRTRLSRYCLLFKFSKLGIICHHNLCPIQPYFSMRALHTFFLPDWLKEPY